MTLLFRTDNTPGCTPEQLAALNSEWIEHVEYEDLREGTDEYEEEARLFKAQIGAGGTRLTAASAMPGTDVPGAMPAGCAPYQVMLDSETVETLARLGHGHLDAGIREAAHRLRQERPPRPWLEAVTDVEGPF